MPFKKISKSLLLFLIMNCCKHLKPKSKLSIRMTQTTPRGG